jgi:regulator of protease activity HflC (stomatin/prohibitin superfamily)
MKYLTLSGLGVAGLIAIAAAIGSVATVQQGTVHVKYIFGEVQPQILVPGVNFVVPFITATKPVDVSIKALPESFSGLSSDGQKITITATSTYNVNPAHLATAVKNNLLITGDLAKDAVYIDATALEPYLLAAVKQVISKYSMTHIINNQAAVSQEIIELINVSLANQAIINLQNLAITGIVLDPEVQASIEAKAIATQEQEAAVIKAETAKILAQQNKILSDSLTPQILEQKAIEKWNGNTFVFGNRTSNTPIILQAPSLPTAK